MNLLVVLVAFNVLFFAVRPSDAQVVSSPLLCNKTVQVLTKQLIDDVHDDAVVCFNVSHLTLNESLIIRDKKNIHFYSLFEETTLDCSAGPQLQLSNGNGLTFQRVTNMSIHNVIIKGCGALHYSTTYLSSSNGRPDKFRSALYMINCTNIELYKVTVSDTNGIGATLFDCNGIINITNCSFIRNSVNYAEFDIYSGGTGLYIELTYCSPNLSKCDFRMNKYNNGSFYQISNSYFLYNLVTRRFQNPLASHNDNRKNNFRGIGKGGGAICIFIKGSAVGNVFDFEEVTVKHNIAYESYGGGLYLQYQDTPSHNIVKIRNSMFTNNTAIIKEAGGINIGFQIKNNVGPSHNLIHLFNVTFVKNKAFTGGAVVLFFGPTYLIDLNNTVIFEKCQWLMNEGSIGAAVYTSAIYYKTSTNNILPSSLFIDCLFSENTINGVKYACNKTDNHICKDDRFEQSSTGSGILFTKLIPVVFSGTNNFVNNKGSGIYCLNSVIKVNNHSMIKFANNVGDYGAGISLIGLSSILIENNTTFNFINNTALIQGGAIYSYSIDKTSTQYFGLCFVQFDYYASKNNNSTFIFNGNSDMEGNSVYVSSLLPCALLCNTNFQVNTSAETFMRCIGKLEFVNSSLFDSVETEGTTFEYERNTQIRYVIPGKPMKLPVEVKDELGHTLFGILLQVKLMNASNTSMKLLTNYTSNNNITFVGRPNDTAHIKVNTINFRNFSFSMNIKLSECPPGYVMNYYNTTCICSALSVSASYNGIFACNEFVSVASIGYWVNYVPPNKANPDNLVTSTCPLGYCYSPPIGDPPYNILAENPSSEELDNILCKPQNRTGILCGQCIENHTVYFHTFEYTCGTNDLCYLGILFYLLSEILPLITIFAVVIVFRVNFTSGYLNGFVLFAQMLNSLAISANGGITILPVQQIFVDIIYIVYSPFNFEFFHIQTLSFCLYEDLNFLQIASIKFLTLVIGLIFVITLVLVMRCACCYKLQLACFKIRLTNSDSLVNGLSAFLILSYGQCCRTCFLILNFSWLHGKGQTTLPTPRVFRMGNIEYFGPEHLPYALVALFFFIFFVIVPTLFMLLQPLSYRLIPEKILNYKKVRVVCSKIELLSPFFDTFQGCFKDKMRFFAGLYLFYRLVASGTFALINTQFTVYIVIEVLLILMLTIHGLAQPYRNPLHNKIDTAIFFLMILINTLTIFRYYEFRTETNFQELNDLTNLQLFLVFLPINCLVIVIVSYLMYKYCWKKLKKNRPDNNTDELPELILSRELTSSMKKDKEEFESFANYTLM
jgi:hypothetical protein